jgi:hypothetical protein
VDCSRCGCWDAARRTAVTAPVGRAACRRGRGALRAAGRVAAAAGRRPAAARAREVREPREVQEQPEGRRRREVREAPTSAGRREPPAAERAGEVVRRRRARAAPRRRPAGPRAEWAAKRAGPVEHRAAGEPEERRRERRGAREGQGALARPARRARWSRRLPGPAACRTESRRPPAVTWCFARHSRSAEPMTQASRSTATGAFST